MSVQPIAALYVAKGGAYFGLEGVDPWDDERDARLYDGPHPVVAHPPCPRWCRFAKQIEKVHGHKVGDDDGCFEAALASVRKFGGVLEHPAHSLAWDAYGLVKPSAGGGWTRTLWDDPWGGSSAYVEQGRYGHPMRKATWLYACGADLPELRWGRTNDQAMLGTYKWGSIHYKPDHMRNRPRLGAKDHSATPIEFRDALIELARSSIQRERAA